MRTNSDDALALADDEVARHWVQRSERDGLARVMRASQPAELNAGVTRETRRIVADFLATAARGLSRPVLSALEVGCGVGRLTPTVAERAERVTALDMTQGMLDAARETCADLSNVEFRRGRAEDLPWGTARFDVGICVWVLMHVLDDDRLAEVGRALAESTRYLVLIEYERAHLPVSRWSRLRTLDEYLAVLPGARLVEHRELDYGGDRSAAALVGFPHQD